LAPGLTEDDPQVVTASAWIDLSKAPVLLRLPPTGGRFYNLTLFDTAGEPFASLGSRSGDDAGVDLAVIGPNWAGELPHGGAAKRAPSENVWAVSRIHAHSEADRDATIALAGQQRIEPLAGDAHEQDAGVRVIEPPSRPCLRQAEHIQAADFFQRLDSLLARAPEYFKEESLAQLNGLRTQLGGPPPASEWSAHFARALALGLSDGFTAIKAAADLVGDSSAWRAARPFENGARSILARAARAYAGLGARARADLLILVCDRDASGRPLSGADCYSIRFPKGQLPPARSGWRLSARPAARRDERRSSLSDRDDLVRGEDGSLEVSLCRPHGDDACPTANWLPTPDGRFSLVMRLCWPSPRALASSWSMPPVERRGAAWGLGDDPFLEPPPTSPHPPWRMTP
jgi:hypothetical protein